MIIVCKKTKTGSQSAMYQYILRSLTIFQFHINILSMYTAKNKGHVSNLHFTLFYSWIKSKTVHATFCSDKEK